VRTGKKEEGERAREQRRKGGWEGERKRVIHCSRSVSDEKRGDAPRANYVPRDCMFL